MTASTVNSPAGMTTFLHSMWGNIKKIPPVYPVFFIIFIILGFLSETYQTSTGIMTFLGLMVVQHKRTGVAYERLGRLMVDAPVATLIEPRAYDLERPQKEFRPSSAALEPLRELRVEGLGYTHPGAAEGIADVSFGLARGEFVVVTGRVGSGKTTLVRVLLGLLPKTAGNIYWNGELVEDPATFFVPPRTAYTSQVPRLFSDTLRENIQLGGRQSPAEVS